MQVLKLNMYGENCHLPDKHLQSTYYGLDTVRLKGDDEACEVTVRWERQKETGNDSRRFPGCYENFKEGWLFLLGVGKSGKAFWRKLMDSSLFLGLFKLLKPGVAFLQQGEKKVFISKACLVSVLLTPLASIKWSKGRGAAPLSHTIHGGN